MKDVTANNNKRRSQSPFGEEEGVSLKRSGFRTMQFIQVSASKDNDDPFHVSILPVKLAEAQSCPVHLQFVEFQLLDAANLGKDCLSYRLNFYRYRRTMPHGFFSVVNFHLLNNRTGMVIASKDNDVPFPMSVLPVKLTEAQSCPDEAKHTLICELHFLEILRCPKFKFLLEEGLPASLRYLEIKECHLLETQLKRKGNEWSKIGHVPSLKIRRVLANLLLLTITREEVSHHLAIRKVSVCEEKRLSLSVQLIQINTNAAVRQSYVAVGCIGHDYQGKALWLIQRFCRGCLHCWLSALRMAAGEAALSRLEQVCLRVILFLLFLAFPILPECFRILWLLPLNSFVR
ncbi:hypothetical protein CJ030_MR1G005696 [Morella rubra]|uniref:Uncharacterized protein n=1 Tax=Morella rubra TaxID=262757 RepID=A0A6A1WQX5_9ROSI|nr:hypothetical protein CJ030_MR1G005696 [Morella rubra]